MESNKTFIEFTFNDEKYCIHRDSDVLIQVGKGKSSYAPRYSFKGHEIGSAIFHYNCINIGRGYKKRLVIPSLNKGQILHRVLS
jgi:hypothetical protein